MLNVVHKMLKEAIYQQYLALFRKLNFLNNLQHSPIQNRTQVVRLNAKFKIIIHQLEHNTLTSINTLRQFFRHMHSSEYVSLLNFEYLLLYVPKEAL